MMNTNGTQSVLQVGERESLALATNSCIVQFMSTTTPRQIPGQAFANITNSTSGYYSAMQTFANTAYTLATWQTALDNNTFYLRPMNNMARLLNARRARLTGYRFDVYDFTETADVIGMEVGNWQPNFCRFQIWINQQPVIIGDSRNGFFDEESGLKHRGDQSIGFPIPFCKDANFFMNNGTGGVSSIEVYAPCGKITNAGDPGAVTAYPVLASLTFVLNEI